jgi:hypothetical protein
MIRLSALLYGDVFAYKLFCDGAEVAAGVDATAIEEELRRLGLDDPTHLVGAAQQWGAVEIRANPQAG